MGVICRKVRGGGTSRVGDILAEKREKKNTSARKKELA